jgi:predicted aconitase with swiveling domain
LNSIGSPVETRTITQKVLLQKNPRASCAGSGIIHDYYRDAA